MSEKIKDKHEESIIEAANALVKLVVDGLGEPPYDYAKLDKATDRISTLSYNFIRVRDSGAEDEVADVTIAAMVGPFEGAAETPPESKDDSKKPDEPVETPKPAKGKGKAKPEPTPEPAPQEQAETPKPAQQPADPAPAAAPPQQQAPNAPQTPGQKLAADYPQLLTAGPLGDTPAEASAEAVVRFKDAAAALQNAAKALATAVNSLGVEGGVLTGLHGPQIVRAIMRRHDLAAAQLLAVPPKHWPALLDDLSTALAGASGLTDAKFEEFCGQPGAVLTAEPKFRDAYDAIATRLVVGKALDGVAPLSEDGF